MSLFVVQNVAEKLPEILALDNNMDNSACLITY